MKSEDVEKGQSDTTANSSSSAVAPVSWWYRKSQWWNNDTTANSSSAGTAAFALRVLQLVLFVSSLVCGILGVYYVGSSNYTPPPIPVAHIVANLLVLPGCSIVLSSTASLVAIFVSSGNCCDAGSGPATAKTSFALLWGVALVVFGVFRFWMPHPYTLPECPCAAHHVKLNGACVQCPGYEKGVCEDASCVCGTTGVCSEITAECVCDTNWQVGVNGTCSECSDRAMDGPRGQCTRCTERFKPDSKTGYCSLCRNGYAGSDCKICHPNFQPRLNDSGAVALTLDGAMICSPVRGCKDDQPEDGGRFGPMCEAVPENQRCAKHGDVNARLEKSNNDMVLPNTFTTMGQTCDYDFECDSYNCLGFCTYGKGGPRQGALCREDADCLGGKCESRTCAAEYKVGEDTCQCSRSGFLAPRCEKCPVRVNNSTLLLLLFCNTITY